MSLLMSTLSSSKIYLTSLLILSALYIEIELFEVGIINTSALLTIKSG